MERIIEKIRDKGPLVHCITNFVTVNDCANILLACGASPTMARDAREVEEITSAASALVLNMGALDNFDSMLLSGRRANRLGIPVVLDPVGAGASRLRNECCAQLLKAVRCDVIRGNISEIKALALGSSSTRGVDAARDDLVAPDSLKAACRMAGELSSRIGAAVAISGAVDVIAGGHRVSLVSNGCAEMARITGSGCMLTSLIGAFCAVCPGDIFASVVSAAAAMGLCGEAARDKVEQNRAGTASFRTYLIDAVSLLDDDRLLEGMKVEAK